jgi:DNA primase
MMKQLQSIPAVSYSAKVLQQVKNATNIVSVIGEFTDLEKRGDSYFGTCPLHIPNEEDTNPEKSLVVSPKKQTFHCFDCGASGDVVAFVMQAKQTSLIEATQYLAARAGIQLPQLTGHEKNSDIRESIVAMNREAGLFYFRQLASKEGEKGLQYLRERGLSNYTIKHFGLGYAPRNGIALFNYLKERGFQEEDILKSGLVTQKNGRITDKFRERVMFPIINTDGEVVGFGGRVMGDWTPKYLNSPETYAFDKSNNLYALNFASKSQGHGMILCEGYMDVISLHQAGFDFAVASLGTAFNETHARNLSRYTDSVHLLFDSDGPGVNAALKAIPTLRAAGLDVDIVNVTPSKDPDEFIKTYGAEAFQERLDAATGSYKFELQHLLADCDLSSREGVQDAVATLGEHLLDIRNESAEPHYLEAFDQLLVEAGQEPMFGEKEEEASILPTSPHDSMESTVQDAYTDEVLSNLAKEFEHSLDYYNYAPDPVEGEPKPEVRTEDEFPELYETVHGIVGEEISPQRESMEEEQDNTEEEEQEIPDFDEEEYEL